jgi:hypothetical protein
MKKKAIAMMLALALVMTAVAFATEEGTGQETEQEVTEKTVTEAQDVIPVYGFLGVDAEVIVPDPMRPETEIYMEVPMRLLFAAFEGDNGAISSPYYAITNLSTVSDVRIEIESFVQCNAEEVPLEEQLTLKLLTETGEDLVTGLFPSEGAQEQALVERLPKWDEETEANQFLFMVGGTWDGEFHYGLQPVFDMTLRFSGAE